MAIVQGGKETIMGSMLVEFLGLKRESSYYKNDLKFTIITHL